ncbi:MAG: sigma-70 family RNA polymerase sigma factor [Planctomycetota bacterium]
MTPTDSAPPESPAPPAAADVELEPFRGRGRLEPFWGPLLRYAGHLLRDPGRAQDAVQDTFARALRLGEGEAPRDFRAWLFTVCRHRCFDVLRKERRMTLLAPSPRNLEHAAAAHANQAGPADTAEANDTFAAIRRHLAALPANQQDVVRLRFQGEMTYRQIADATGHSVSHVGVLLHTAIKTLRSQLTDC